MTGCSHVRDGWTRLKRMVVKDTNLPTRQSMASCLSLGVGVRIVTPVHFTTVVIIPELELNIKFPTCWDGVNVEDVEGKHMVFSEECYEYESNECFDFGCPSSHPVRLPEIHLYVRILEYEGGAHVFANDTDVS